MLEARGRPRGVDSPALLGIVGQLKKYGRMPLDPRTVLFPSKRCGVNGPPHQPPNSALRRTLNRAALAPSALLFPCGSTPVSAGPLADSRVRE